MCNAGKQQPAQHIRRIMLNVTCFAWQRVFYLASALLQRKHWRSFYSGFNAVCFASLRFCACCASLFLGTRLASSR